MGLEAGKWENIKMYNFRYPLEGEGNHGGFVYYTEDGQAIAAVKFVAPSPEEGSSRKFITVSEPAPHRLYLNPDLKLFHGFKSTTLETGWEFTYDVNYGEHGAFIYHNTQDNTADLDILAVGSALSSGEAARKNVFWKNDKFFVSPCSSPEELPATAGETPLHDKYWYSNIIEYYSVRNQASAEKYVEFSNL